VQTLLQWKNNKYYIFWVWVCSLRYPTCNAHAPYCQLWPVWLYCIFPHNLIAAQLKKKLLNIKCVFWFSLQLASETLLILRTEQDMIKYVQWSSCKVPVILVRFWCNLNFLDRVLKNTQIANLMKIRPVGTESFHADRQDKANICFFHFCKHT